MEVTNSEQLSRFEIEIEGKKAFISYQQAADGNFNLLHTEVPEKFEGKGIGSKLVKQTLEKIKADGKKTSCPALLSRLISSGIPNTNP